MSAAAFVGSVRQAWVAARIELVSLSFGFVEWRRKSHASACGMLGRGEGIGKDEGVDEVRAACL